jgi:hypothetical protein
MSGTDPKRQVLRETLRKKIRMQAKQRQGGGLQYARDLMTNTSTDGDLLQDIKGMLNNKIPIASKETQLTRKERKKVHKRMQKMTAEKKSSVRTTTAATSDTVICNSTGKERPRFSCNV